MLAKISRISDTVIRPLVRRVARTIAWSFPGLYLRLYIKFRLRRSEYYKLSQECRTYQPGQLSAPEADTSAAGISRRNILFAIHWYELSGAELFALYCIKTAKALGHTCHCVSTVVSENPEKPAFAEHCIAALDLDDLPVDRNFEEYILDYIAEQSIDVVHIHHSVLMYKALPALRERFPRLLIVDTTHIIEYRNGGFPQISARFSLYIDVHNVASVGLMRAQQEMYKRAFGRKLDDRKFHLTYTSSLTPVNTVPLLSETKPSKVVTFYGRFAPQKQPYVFVATMERLYEKHPELDVCAHFFGTGEMRADLKRRVSLSKFNHRFHVFGRNDNKAEVFKNTDILFLSSINEGLSFTSFEALIYDRLVVCSDVGDQGELICRDCLIPLTPRFIENAADRLAMFLADDEKYSKALASSKANLEKIRLQEVNPVELGRLYSWDAV